MPDRLRVHAQAAADRSHAPYSRMPAGCAVLLADGQWTSAPRVENASFPLTIPALQGALALAALSGGTPAVVAHSRPLTDADLAQIAQATEATWRLAEPDVAVMDGHMPPVVGEPVPLTLDLPPPRDADDGVALAVAAASRAAVPASAFPVGAVAVDADGRMVAGANVEVVGDWTRGLCAERTALVAAIAAGLGPVRRLYIACTLAPGGTPCGACRQVIAELAPEAEVVIWRGSEAPETTTPDALLPGAFRGEGLGVG